MSDERHNPPESVLSRELMTASMMHAFGFNRITVGSYSKWHSPMVKQSFDGLPTYEYFYAVITSEAFERGRDNIRAQFRNMLEMGG